ncbi:MAG: N-acetyl-gamma-glutamyl-phosphate reductase [Gemmatimonadetes bacterium]|nr:N-acetyl-gamma-glutamyl-phosphate reductase [Gemmatimonadota bacterium]
MIRAAIYGASGYGGAELLRLLLLHPEVAVRQASSREAGRRVDAIHPGLRGLTDLVLVESAPEALERDLDAVFFSLPHGHSTAVMDRVAERCPQARLYDLAQDFRTGAELKGWVYGLPELFRDQLPDARKVACPGCFATAILLGTAPALCADPAPGRIIVDAKTGSSGSGATAQQGTHHPTRAGTLKAYKVFSHQHEAEIRAAWSRLAPGRPLPPLSFVPQSTPAVRGIYACSYLVYDGAKHGNTAEWYARFYAGSPFVRVVEEPPNVIDVRGTNNADIYVQDGDGVTVVISSVDNLVRGAAGQAVQCFNLGFGFPETTGLKLPALIP